MAVMDKLPSLPSVPMASMKEADRKTFVFGGWLVGAIMLVFSNRYILIDLKFAAPLALVAWQALGVVCVTQAFAIQARLGEGNVPAGQPISWEVYTTYIVSIGALLGIAPLWSTIASDVLPLWQMAVLHGLTPLVAAGLSRMLGVRFNASKFMYIAALMIALLIATIGGMKFGKYDTDLTDKQIYGAGWTGNEHILSMNRTIASAVATLSSDEILGTANEEQVAPVTNPAAWVNTAIATLCGIFAVGAEAGSKVLMEAMLKARTERMTPSRLLRNIAPIWFVVAALCSAMMESPNAQQFFNLPTGVLLSNSLAAIVVAYCVPAIIQMSSATTYILADSFRQTFVSFLACVVYNIPIGILHALSYFVGFAGFAKYAEKELPAEAQSKSSSYIMHSVTTDGDQEENTPDTTEYEEEKVAEALGTSVNMFVVLCGLLLSVLVMASMTTRPVLSPAQAVTYERALIPYEQSKIATIIETRNLPHLGPLILQFITVLPPDWPVLAWCSPENIEVLRQIPAIARNVEIGRLELRLFPLQFDIHDQEYLSRFLTKPWLWETLEREWILFFQSDSMLCSKSPQKIDDWLGFDWVGAPWQDSPNARGGNGGLSLRKRSSMIKLTSNPDIAREDYGDPEDVWFSRRLAELPGVKWPTEHQAKFSVENIFGSMSEWSWRPLGVHSGGSPPPTWRDEEVMNRLMDWCPELRLFYDPRKYIGT